jgi:hypothetical protein
MIFLMNFEMRSWIDGLLFPIGKICRRSGGTLRSQAIHLRLSVCRCWARAGEAGELSVVWNVRSWHFADKPTEITPWPQKLNDISSPHRLKIRHRLLTARGIDPFPSAQPLKDY